MDEFTTLVIELEHPDVGRRQQALAQIEARGDLAVPLLRRALNLGHGAARARAAELLAGFGLAAVNTLGEALSDPDAEARLWAAWSLGRIDDPSATRLLVGALADPDLQVRRQVVQNLAESKVPAAVPALCKALADKDPGIRRQVAEALGGCADPGAVPPLCGVLWDPNMGVRLEAIGALGKLGSRLAVPYLAERLTDQSLPIARAAARSLGQIRAPEAVPPLVAAMKGREASLSEDAGSALVEIGSPAAYAVAYALLDMNPRGRSLAANVLERIGQPSIPYLCQLVGWRSHSIRTTAIRSLRNLARREPCIQLRAALPLLESRLRPLSGTGEIEREACRAAIQQIELGTRGMQDLPLPAEAAPPSGVSLPLPASVGSTDSRPEREGAAEAWALTETKETRVGYVARILRVFRREA